MIKASYNLEYFDMLLRNNREYGEKIARIRWDFVRECDPRVVLDFGSGVPFFRAYRPTFIRCDTYDIGPYPQTGIFEPFPYDLVTFWDSLEHIDWFNNPDQMVVKLLKEIKFVALTVPILPERQPVDSWKHTKPGEHLTRFNKVEEVMEFFNNFNYKLIKIATPECPPRQDIYSFLFKKRSI